MQRQLTERSRPDWMCGSPQSSPMIVRPLFPALFAIVFFFPFPAAGEDRKRPRPIISPTMEGDRITFLLREPSANEVLLTGSCW